MAGGLDGGGGDGGGEVLLQGGTTSFDGAVGGQITLVSGTSSSMGQSGGVTLSSADDAASGAVYLSSGEASSGLSGEVVIGSGRSDMTPLLSMYLHGGKAPPATLSEPETLPAAPSTGACAQSPHLQERSLNTGRPRCDVSAASGGAQQV